MGERTEPSREDDRPEPELSVVVPMYDEAAVVALTARRLHRWLAQRATRGELWMIDDGSTDDTRRIAEALRSELPWLKVEGFDANRGRGAALRHGLERAHGAVVVTTEADLSWGLEVLGRLVELVRDGGIDVAVASPYRPGGALVGVPWTRRILSWSAHRVTRRTLGTGITMATGATRAYRRGALPGLLSPADGKVFHLDTLCRALRAGRTVAEVPATITWRDPARRRRPTGGGRGLGQEVAAHVGVLLAHGTGARGRR